ncbi:MAG: hypothetical protein AAFV98_15355 [Chloroflexota bacterium]
MTHAYVQSGEAMSYELEWHTSDKVLLLTLSGNYSVDEAKEANRLILDELDQADNLVFILIDAMNMTRPYNFGEIRAVQSFMDHRNLSHIYVGTGDRLVKLAMMVIFNLSRAYLHICDDTDKANFMLERQLNIRR